MEPNQTQQNIPEEQGQNNLAGQDPNTTDVENPKDGIPLSTDDIAAAMGWMTTMGEQRMKEEHGITDEEEPEEGEEDLGEEKIDTEELTDKITSKLQEDMRSIIKDELKKLLNEDEDEDKNETTTTAE